MKSEKRIIFLFSFRYQFIDGFCSLGIEYGQIGFIYIHIVSRVHTKYLKLARDRSVKVPIFSRLAWRRL